MKLRRSGLTSNIVSSIRVAKTIVKAERQHFEHSL